MLRNQNEFLLEHLHHSFLFSMRDGKVKWKNETGKKSLKTLIIELVEKERVICSPIRLHLVDYVLTESACPGGGGGSLYSDDRDDRRILRGCNRRFSIFRGCSSKIL